jgi:hypothetical protein
MRRRRGKGFSYQQAKRAMQRDVETQRTFDMAHETSNCKGCGRRIIWSRSTETGKTVPLDMKETTVFRLTEDGGAEPVGGVHLNHFITCPEREQFRRKP